MRFHELDLFRFLAAVGVVIYHYKTDVISRLGSNPELAESIYWYAKFGYLGVNLFFMISGFVILASALNRSPIEFAISRGVRLYPTLWICATLTTLLVWLAGDDVRIALGSSEITFTQLLANFTLLNQYLGIGNLDGSYWTLLEELKFYACIGLLIAFGAIHQYRLWLPLWLAATCTFALIGQPFFMGWFISPEYSSYFIAGVAFYLAARDGFDMFNTAVISVSLLLSTQYALSEIYGFVRDPSLLDQYLAVFGVWFFYLLFYLIAAGRLRLRATPLIATLGGLTYPLYLLHSRAGKTLFVWFGESLHPVVLIALITLLMLLLAWGLYELVDRRLAGVLRQRLSIAAEQLQAHWHSAAPRWRENLSQWRDRLRNMQPAQPRVEPLLTLPAVHNPPPMPVFFSLKLDIPL